MLECSRLDYVRLKYRIDADVSIEIMSNPELLIQLLMDSTSLGVLTVHQGDDNKYVIGKTCNDSHLPEFLTKSTSFNLSYPLCSSKHRKPSIIYLSSARQIQLLNPVFDR